MSRSNTDTQVVFDQDSGVIGGFSRSKGYAVGSERFITVLIHAGAGIPVAQKFRAFGTIKTLGNSGYDPIDIDNVSDANNTFAPVYIRDMDDRNYFEGSTGLDIVANKNGLFQIEVAGMTHVFFEIEGGGVPVSLFIKSFN
jgi:hypothetical protein